MIELKSDLINQYLKINNNILAVFGSSQCKHCIDLKPQLYKLSSEYPEREIIFIDCDKFPISADLYDIDKYPTIIHFKYQLPIHTETTSNINRIKEIWKE